MVYTEKYKAAWIYYTTPFIEPGQIISGGIKAVILQIHLLITLIYLIISIALIGYSIIPNIILGIINQILIAYIIMSLAKKNFPFSKHLLNAKKSASFLSLFISVETAQ